MRAFAPMIGELARRELTTWNGRVVALDRMRELTLDIILRVVFGARDEELAHLRDVIEDSLASVRSLPWVLAMAVVRKDLGPRSPWGRFRVAVERFDAELYALLARRRAETREDSVLALLLEQRDEEGRPPNDRHLRDQLVALLVGGHDSSAASLAWAFELLSRRPEVHARLRDGDPAYLDAVVKEVLRLYPVVPIIGLGRKLAAPMRFFGHDLPAGVKLVATAYTAHRRADVYPDPGRFSPERFLHQKIDPHAWLPFGGGVRRCLGLSFALHEIKVVLATLLGAARLGLARRCGPPCTASPSRPRVGHTWW
jgi:cytochrome P450 family 135